MGGMTRPRFAIPPPENGMGIYHEKDTESERDISHGLINETFVSSSRSSHEFGSESKTKRILSVGLRVYFSTIIMIPVYPASKTRFSAVSLWLKNLS